MSFITIVVVIDFGVRFLGNYMQVHAKGGDTRTTNDLVMNECHDVLIFGSSRAGHHYDTPYMSEALGLDVYNAGYDGNGVVLSYGLLSMLLGRYQPLLIIFDVEPAFDINVYAQDNGHKRYISRLKPYFCDKHVRAIIKDVSSEEFYKTYSGMIQYNTTIINKLQDNLFGVISNRKGFRPLQGSYTSNSSKSKTKSELDTFKVGYVEKFLLLAHSKNIPIVVVASPKFGEESSDDVQPVKDICVRLNVPFWDFYSDSCFMEHREWFKEPMHLNEKGAREFSRRVLEKISLMSTKG